MDFLKFTILNDKADQQLGIEETEILINKNHIVSIKPINIRKADGDILKGFWIRNSNGKKYKATKVPTQIKEVFGIYAKNGLPEEEAELVTLNQ